MYKRILVATDGSTLSKKAITSAIELAALSGAELIAVKVTPRYPQSYFEGSLPLSASEVSKIEKAWTDGAQKVLDAVAKSAKAKGVSTKTVVIKSDVVSDALIAAAKKHKADLIVMASHGRRGIKRLLLGSETQQVLTSNILMNLEGEGMGEVRDYYRRRLLRMGAIKPNEKEAKELAAEQANQQPDPQSLYLMREAEKAEALAVKARADTVETLASADLKAAQTVKTQAETDGARVDQAVNVADALQRVAQPFGGSTPPTIQAP